MREAIATGNTVQEAYEKACAMLGVETYLAEQEILEMQQRAQRTSPPVKAETAAERAARIKLAKKIMKVAVIACAAMFGLGLLIGLGAYLVSVLMI